MQEGGPPRLAPSKTSGYCCGPDPKSDIAGVWHRALPPWRVAETMVDEATSFTAAARTRVETASFVPATIWIWAFPSFKLLLLHGQIAELHGQIAGLGTAAGERGERWHEELNRQSAPRSSRTPPSAPSRS